MKTSPSSPSSLSRRSSAFALALLAAAAPALTHAADTPAPTSPDQRGPVRVVSGGVINIPDRGNTVNPTVRVLGRPVEIEKENVPFLGVETGPVNATLAAQLNLTSGAGLVVNHVLPDSPAAAVLKTHDILLKLDDQILVEQRQLAVLLRQRKAGDEVTLTYLRGAKEATTKVKLTQHEVPKLALAPTGVADLLMAAGRPTASADYITTVPGAPIERAQMDRMLSLVQAREGQPFTIRIDQGGPLAGVRSMSIDRNNSSLVYNDDAGALELNVKDGVKTLVAKNAKGETLFSGPVTTEAERKKLPEDVRARLEKLEGMHEVRFRTDSDFQGTETKVGRPLGRGVSLPMPAAPASPTTPGRFF